MAEFSPKQVENIVGKGEIARYEQFLLFPHCFQKGEIARYEQFLLFPHCFQKTLIQTRKNQGLFGRG